MTVDDSAAAASRRELLELLLADEGIEVAATASIPPRDPDADMVVSYAQERLWFLQQFDDDTSGLSIRAMVRLSGTLDIDAMRSALDQILQRHESLRTLIDDVGGSPKPRPVERTEMPLIIDDLRTAPDIDAALADVLDTERARTFDLTSDLPILVRITRTADDEHVLSVVVHHVASDGWSMQVLFREIADRYSAIAHGTPSALPSLPITYADYAAWQRGLSDDKIDAQLQYWRDQLGGDVPTCEIPPDLPRMPIHTVDGAQVQGTLPGELLERLRALSQQQGATLFMTMLTAFNVVLDRRTDRPADEHDVSIGTPVAGRVRAEFEHLIGVFLNTLVIRTDLGGDPTFSELVDRVRDQSLGAFANQDVPFERLLSDLQPARDLSRTPFFSVFFNMMSIDQSDGTDPLASFDYEFIEQPDLGAKFDITVYVNDHRDRDEVSMLLVYNRNLYRPDTIRQLLDQYIQVLETVVEQPTIPISEISLVTTEAASVLPAADQSLDDRWHGSIPDAINRHASSDSAHPAVVDDDGQWTYGELAQSMNQLARLLQDQGVQRGDTVAIRGHRSAPLVWAAAASLAAGGAYTILDPAYPSARLATSIRTIRPVAFLDIAANGDLPPELSDVLDEVGVTTRLSLPPRPRHGDVTGLAAMPSGPLDIEIGSNDLACVTFTSGSSGQPKAVLGRHGSLTHFLPWQSSHFAIGPADRFSMLSGLAHDPIQRDMFWPLWLGATIVVPDPDQMLTAGWIADWLRSERVNVVHATPAMGELMLEAGPDSGSDGPLHDLKLMLFIGDALHLSTTNGIHRLAPDAEIVNLYGTTETQRASGHHVVDPVVVEHAKAVHPIGVGIPGTQLLLRSESGSAVGFGEVGEVWMRSHHLALGYLDRADETAQRFHTTPGATISTDRMYRTGDLARFRHDGVVEYVARADDQVQLRGFRIELGDVRAALVEHPAVSDAVVVLRSTADGPGILVAYYVTDDDLADTGELAATVRERLPAHMVPARFVRIGVVPMTPNGKLDRAALPASTDDDTLAAEGVAPRDTLERLLVGLWSEVLGRDDVGIHDDFFALGGYSLLATRLFAQIESATGERVPVSALFLAPTVATLADTIRTQGWRSHWTSLTPISPAGSSRPLFYVTPYLISVLQLVHLGTELGEDQPLYGLQPQGIDDDGPVHHSIEEMAAHYISEMRTLQPHGPYLVGGHCSGAWVAFEMARQLEADGDDLDAVILVDQGPPNVERPEITPWKYLVNRTKFFFADGRLRHAVAWQAKIAMGRLLLRRVGTQSVRVVEEVKQAHRDAHTAYQGGHVESDLVLLRSQETLALQDRNWFDRWEDMTAGSLHLANVRGTHANLLERPHVEDLAEKIQAALAERDQQHSKHDPES